MADETGLVLTQVSVNYRVDIDEATVQLLGSNYDLIDKLEAIEGVEDVDYDDDAGCILLTLDAEYETEATHTKILKELNEFLAELRAEQDTQEK